MTRLNDAMVVVAGGTGNVGSHVVSALLAEGARVVVPSRSPAKLHDLAQYLGKRIPADALDKLIPLVGEVGEEADAERVAAQIVAELGSPTAVFAALGRFTPAPTLLGSNTDALQQVVRDYLTAHYAVARAFLPRMRNGQGKYVFVNGPLAFEPWENTASGLVSIATAAQHMLFRALALELKGALPQLIELVIYSFVRHRETQPGASVSGEAIGAYAVALLAGAAQAGHGESIHLRSSPPQPAA